MSTGPDPAQSMDQDTHESGMQANAPAQPMPGRTVPSVGTPVSTLSVASGPYSTSSDRISGLAARKTGSHVRTPSSGSAGSRLVHRGPRACGAPHQTTHALLEHVSHRRHGALVIILRRQDKWWVKAGVMNQCPNRLGILAEAAERADDLRGKSSRQAPGECEAGAQPPHPARNRCTG